MTDELELWPGEVQRLEAELDEAKAKEQKQLMWWVIGTTPAAILPTAVAMAYDKPALATAFVATAVVIQTGRWFGAKRAVWRLERDAEEARAALRNRPVVAEIEGSPGAPDDAELGREAAEGEGRLD